MGRRIHSFVWGGLAAAALIALGISNLVSGGAFTDFAIMCGVAIAAFTFISCLILANNFVGDVVGTIFSWGFVRMPGLIFTLDLDGIIWLLTVKLLFWILGILLAILFGIFAIVIGSIISIFVYPYALYKNMKGIEED